MHRGIIVIDKPRDYTSHDVIAVLRGIFKMRRIGHSGTLDPMAIGVLPVFLGEATRCCEFASGHDKEYVVRFRLGLSTDTGDITGRVIGEKAVRVSQKEVGEALCSFVGRISQVPPMYSAVKVDGKRLYEYARRGVTVERKAREITVYRAELINAGETPPEYEARILCSAGTYIRTICTDLGDALGCGAVMTALRRTRSGMFRIEEALSLQRVGQLAESGEIERYILAPDTLFMEYPGLRVDSYGETRVRNGAFVPLSSVEDGPPLKPGGLCRVYAPDGAFLMLGRQKPLFSGGQAIFCEKNFFC